MSFRIYISPPVLTRPVPPAYAAKAAAYMTQWGIHWIPTGADNKPASPWVLSIGRAPNWVAASADAALQQLFPIPATIDSRAALRTFLRDTAIADGTPSQQAALLALLDSLDVYHGDIVLTVSLGRVLRRVMAFLMEKDINYGDIGGEE